MAQYRIGTTFSTRDRLTFRVATQTAGYPVIPSHTIMASRHDVDAPMTVRALLRQPTGYLPVVMSLAALAMIVWFVAMHGVVHQPDEGAQAHLWQLLVAGQLPLIGYFAIRWLPTATRPAIVVLALQTAAVMLLAFAPLWALGGL